MFVLSAFYGVLSKQDNLACVINKVTDVLPWLAGPVGSPIMLPQPNGNVITLRNDNILSVIVQPEDFDQDILPEIPTWLLRGDHPPLVTPEGLVPITSAMPVMEEIGQLLADNPARMLLAPSRRWMIVPDDGFDRLIGVNLFMSRSVSLYRPLPMANEETATKQ